MQEVEGSSPSSSTSLSHGFALAGLVAAEGTFVVTRKTPPFANGDLRLRFVFQLAMAARDRSLLEQLQTTLGVGSIVDRAPARTGWLPSACYRVSSIRAHRLAVIPFMEEHLLFGVKRAQFLDWRARLDEYELSRPTRWGRGRNMCSEPGCVSPVRGRGLCRVHYYRATGH